MSVWLDVLQHSSEGNLTEDVKILTHWGRVTHICVGKLTVIASDNGLSPGRRQAIIWTNAGILLIGPLGTNFNEILIAIHTFSFKKMRLKVSSAKRRPFCLGLNELTPCTDTAKTFGLSLDWGQILPWFCSYQTWLYTGILPVLVIFYQLMSKDRYVLRCLLVPLEIY